MKYFLGIFLCILLSIIGGCHQYKNIPTSEISSGNQFSPILMEPKKEQFKESDFALGSYLGGLYTPLFVSGNTFVASGIFSFVLPKEITQKNYYSQYSPATKSFYEQVGFINRDKTKVFTIYISQLPNTTSTDTELCPREYPDGYLTKSKKIYTIQGQQIYVYYATLMTNGLDVEPVKIIDTQFCFAHNGLFFRFFASNYLHTDIDILIKSLNFAQ